jgi:hypothetical protein
VAAVSGTAAPAGSVYFADEGGAVLGSADLDSGRAQLTTSALPPGPHRVRAVYSGGARFSHSSSDWAEVSVERAQPAVAPLASGTPASGTAVGVSVSGVDGATPGGSVTFVEQDTVLGTAPVQDQGRALLSTAGLAAGAHRVVAVYNGDGNYASGSTSFTVVGAGSAPADGEEGGG